MPGELRDLISILAGIFAAQTGHLVLTTLHANSAFSIPERMITMGANAGLVADAQLLIGLISQRLVQVLCPHCRVPWSVKKTSSPPKNVNIWKSTAQWRGYAGLKIFISEMNRDVLPAGRRWLSVANRWQP
ncbi:ATPase, T2SS/T4P/T4SS family [Apirhabdus apintestini]|nr:ATPase, T2SS/T4P/T4SS family [Enterobacteriaceae bacterium CA-0114]